MIEISLARFFMAFLLLFDFGSDFAGMRESSPDG
jgi:hypothetical protein